ncbi:hypothetical protein BDB00DRAFT_755133 [Zychaea mexicana]|uniref:uncharacterized protein n=1 Tax=Zychaea mexicana TaxID=64656 RepID=UPI0022FE9245|nr:uncharacterized protein BDB00DRAFT_755133 [Zychaea mexicana]KAI9498316.1 hypothetical protein BDB00DRAFT_755133 [Zychaea mexicana]
MTNALSEYYENIVDQVMATLTEEITLSAPRSYITSLRSFVHDLRDHLNLMRANLLASIRPLVESNLPSVLPYTQQQQQQQQQDIAVIGARLTEDILSLNRHIVLQLGLILNVEEAADIIISQSMPTRVLLLEDATHLQALAWLETLRRESEEEQQRPESRALTHWLRSWLSEVEEILRVQFDERVQDATQSILEDFLIDDSY